MLPIGAVKNIAQHIAKVRNPCKSFEGCKSKQSNIE
jgi:hypothetical protein